MRYFNKPFRIVSGGEVYHVAFEVDGKVISFESNPYTTDTDTMVIWDSMDEYVEDMGLEPEQLKISRKIDVGRKIRIIPDTIEDEDLLAVLRDHDLLGKAITIRAYLETENYYLFTFEESHTYLEVRLTMEQFELVK